MGTTREDGSLKDSTPDSFCNAIVVNKLTGEEIRFRTIYFAQRFKSKNPTIFVVKKVK